MLPLDLVAEVISHVRDIDTLRSCSLACSSWYTAINPAHYSLEIGYYLDEWNKALTESSEPRNLLPLVGRFSIVHPISTSHRATPTLTGLDILNNVSSFTNLRELRIDSFSVRKFIAAQGSPLHLVSTLQSLVLVRPKGSHRQILYFIGLFRNLRDFGLISYWPIDDDGTTDSLKLSLPPLRGWLAPKWGDLETIVDLMITLRPRFHLTGVDLSAADPCTPQRIIDACVKTLVTCQFGEGENFFDIEWEGPTDINGS